jgi:hypothetical protein
MDDNDIWSAASLVIDRHGEAAPQFADQQANTLLDQGDVQGSATWVRIGAAIKDLKAGNATYQETPESLFENYADYNRALRAWFVTFGLGGPALFIVQPMLVETLKMQNALAWVVLPFLAGCASQIFIAFINKTYAFYAYDAAGKRPVEPVKEPWATIGKCFWLDVGCDAFTMIAFTTAIWVLLGALVF